MIWTFLFLCCFLQNLIVDCSRFEDHVKQAINYSSLKSESSVSKVYTIYSKITGKWVQIRGRRVNANGVNGTIYVKMKVSSYGFGGYITLQGVASKKYICMNKRGKLQAKRKINRRFCVFKEIRNANFFVSFSNRNKPKWLIGFKKNGRAKRGKKTKPNHQTVSFLKYPEEQVVATTRPQSSLNETGWDRIGKYILKRIFKQRRKRRFRKHKMMGDDPRISRKNGYYSENDLIKVLKTLKSKSKHEKRLCKNAKRTKNKKHRKQTKKNGSKKSSATSSAFVSKLKKPHNSSSIEQINKPKSLKKNLNKETLVRRSHRLVESANILRKRLKTNKRRTSINRRKKEKALRKATGNKNTSKSIS